MIFRQNVTNEEWQTLEENWSWFFDVAKYKPIGISAFGDVVLEKDGRVFVLEVNEAELQEIASDVETFIKKVEDNDVEDWFLLGLYNELQEAGMVLEESGSYGFTRLPVMGGAYEVSNVCLGSTVELIGMLGGVHNQLKFLPDGAEIKFEIED